MYSSLGPRLEWGVDEPSGTIVGEVHVCQLGLGSVPDGDVTRARRRQSLDQQDGPARHRRNGPDVEGERRRRVRHRHVDRLLEDHSCRRQRDVLQAGWRRRGRDAPPPVDDHMDRRRRAQAHVIARGHLEGDRLARLEVGHRFTSSRRSARVEPCRARLGRVGERHLGERVKPHRAGRRLPALVSTMRLGDSSVTRPPAPAAADAGDGLDAHGAQTATSAPRTMSMMIRRFTGRTVGGHPQRRPAAHQVLTIIRRTRAPTAPMDGLISTPIAGPSAASRAPRPHHGPAPAGRTFMEFAWTQAESTTIRRPTTVPCYQGI